MDTISVLKQYGLNQREVALYLACLELGPSLVWRIAQKAKIKRTTVYLVAQSLKEKGLLSEFRDKKGIHYVAEPPETLIDNLQAKQRKIQEILPQLKVIAYQDAIRPKITFYEGLEGVREVCDDSLRQKNSEVLFMSSLKDLYRILSPSYDAKHYIPKRLVNNIKIRMMVFKDSYTTKMVREDKKENRETRFLPNEFNFLASQFIYNNKIAYVSSEKELIGVIVESKDLANLERNKFEMIWDWVGSNKSV